MIVLLNSNYKGGVSKTIGNVLLTHQLSERGYTVLFLDFDPQMSGTRFLTNIESDSQQFIQKNIFQAVLKDDLESNISVLNEYIDYVVGHEFINLFEEMMNKKSIATEKRHLYFRALLSEICEQKYDFVIMDMSPSKSVLNTAVMATATHHIVTTQPQVLSIEMIEKYIDDITELQTLHQIKSGLLGISISMNESTKLSKWMVDLTFKYFGDMMFETITRKRSRIAEYATTGYPKINTRGELYKKDIEALSLHKSLTLEVLERLGMPSYKGGNLSE